MNRDIKTLAIGVAAFIVGRYIYETIVKPSPY